MNASRVADDVQIGGYETIFADDEACAERFLISSSTELSDGYNGWAGCSREALDTDDLFGGRRGGVGPGRLLGKGDQWHDRAYECDYQLGLGLQAHEQSKANWRKRPQQNEKHQSRALQIYCSQNSKERGL